MTLRADPPRMVVPMPDAARPLSVHVPALTGLRGLAAALIFVVHLALPASFTGRFPLLTALKEAGWIGVPLFFVLSGYLVTRLGLAEVDAVGQLNLTRFYIRRLLRIGPLYYLIVAVAVLYWWALSETDGVGVVPGWAPALMTFTTNVAVTWWAWDGPNALLPFWTLAVEAQFYALWGAALRLASWGVLVKVAVAAVAASWACRLGIRGDSFLAYRIHPGVALGSPAAGCLLALSEGPIRRALRPRDAATRTALAGLLLIGYFNLALLGWPPPTAGSGAFVLTAAADLWSAAAVFVAASKIGESRAAFSPLSCRPLVRLGEVSYCVYAIHLGLMHWYHGRRGDFEAFLPDPESWPIASVATDGLLVGVVTLAVSVVWTAAETPIRQRLLRVEPEKLLDRGSKP